MKLNFSWMKILTEKKGFSQTNKVWLKPFFYLNRIPLAEARGYAKKLCSFAPDSYRIARNFE